MLYFRQMDFSGWKAARRKPFCRLSDSGRTTLSATGIFGSAWFKFVLTFCFVCVSLQLAQGQILLDQRPAKPGEWGYRPADGSETTTNPPSFSWRPRKEIVSWEIECREAGEAKDTNYQADVEKMNVHCPSDTFRPGKYTWRYRGIGPEGKRTEWSRVRRFTVPADAVEMPMPDREELMGRIPKRHPRLFLRPETLPTLRKAARGRLKAQYEELVARCDKWVKSPPPTDEPPKYPDGMVRNSDAWRKIWWGNRRHTIRALNAAATLGFTHLLGGGEAYGRLAKRIDRKSVV